MECQVDRSIDRGMEGLHIKGYETLVCGYEPKSSVKSRSLGLCSLS